MSANRAKRKGSRVENEVIRLHLECGLVAAHITRQAARGGLAPPTLQDAQGDLIVLGVLCAEVKARKDGQGFKTLANWLGENDLIFLKQNYREPLVVMPWKTYALLAGGRHHEG